MITFPYIQGVKNLFPEAEIDFLTREESESIPKAISLFSSVHILKGGRSTRWQAFHAVIMGIFLRKKYDVVVDLQNNRISKIVMQLVKPLAWSLFDRISPIAAGERTAKAISQVGFKKMIPDYSFTLVDPVSGSDLLKNAGWSENQMLIVLNPAGFLTSRNWPLDSYVKFAKLWLQQYSNCRFLILGIDRIKDKSEYLHQQLGPALIDLVGKTSPSEAFSIIQKAALVLTEDSGLMHMAWISGKATVALFGSSRSDWSRPLGPHSVCLNSSDLECGECMQPECKYGDVRCLTRFTPEIVFNRARRLLIEWS